MSLSELSKYVFTSKYARYIPEKKRRETWHEAVTRVKDMHLGKFPDLAEEIEWAFNFVYKKKVSPSQRTLQFGGDAVLKHNTRAYNCCATYVDRLRVFQEIMYCLLCGTGAGFSVQKQHVEKLPKLYYGEKTQKTFSIPDTIEGWSDAIGVLISSYFVEVDNTPFHDFVRAEVSFDYSQIRPKGSKLSSSSGKAPGPKPLETAIEKVRNILDDAISNQQIKLSPIQSHDIICHLADAVLSGGVRRSSCISLFSIDDQEMMAAKTGDWFYTNPQRARANNSVVLNRNKTTKEDLCHLIENIKQYGEPGISLSSLDDGSEVTNPCLRGNVLLSTHNGLYRLDTLEAEKCNNLVVVDNKPFKDANGVSLKEATQVVKTGINKQLFLIETRTGHSVESTEYHKFPTINGILPLKDLKIGDTLYLQSSEGEWGKLGSYKDGFVLGLLTSDGSISIDSTHKSAFIDLWDNKKEFSEYVINAVNSLLNTKLKFHICTTKTTTSKIRCGGVRLYRYFSNFLDLDDLYDAKINVPDFIFTASRDFVIGYINGLFAGDGTVNKSGHKHSPTISVRLGQSNKAFLQKIQIILQNFGIVSNLKLRLKNTRRAMPGGTYNIKDYYELIINKLHATTMLNKGLLIGRHAKKLKKLIEKYPPTGIPTYKTQITNIIPTTIEDVYCLHQPETETIIANGVVTGQCHEISLYPQIDCKSGIQFCNLTSINVKKCKTQEEFYEAAKAAAIIGTLQAAYTDFPYLGKVTEEITRKEALLGVCLSGMMDNPNIALDANTQAKAAKVVLETNKEFAKKLGINPAARATSVKPSGTDSLVAETSAGIHPHHSRRYLRRAQANDTESVARHFANHNPMAVEKSVWGASGSDLSLIFCVETEEGARTKNDVSAIDLLKAVKTTKDNWIKYGKNESLCSHPALSHNVSNTIHIKDHEWDEAINYIYENLDSFGGISFLPHSGDLDYHQPPFCAVHTPKEILKKYGDASIFASGLIVDGMYNFGDLWTACDAVLGRLNQFEETPETKQWIYKVNKFAHKYYDGDVRKVTYLMKEVYNWKKWLDLNANYQQVDYTTLIEGNDDTSLEENLACSGGSCELI